MTRKRNARKRTAAGTQRNEIPDFQHEPDVFDARTRRSGDPNGVAVRNFQSFRLDQTRGVSQPFGLADMLAILVRQYIDLRRIVTPLVAHGNIDAVAIDDNDTITADRQNAAKSLRRAIEREHLSAVLGIEIKPAAGRRKTLVPRQSDLHVTFLFTIVQTLFGAPPGHQQPDG